MILALWARQRAIVLIAMTDDGLLALPTDRQSFLLMPVLSMAAVPRARAAADVKPPQAGPPGMMCRKVRKGKAGAELTKAAMPNRPTGQASANVAAVIMATAKTCGLARRQSIRLTGACSISCVSGVQPLDKSSCSQEVALTQHALSKETKL